MTPEMIYDLSQGIIILSFVVVVIFIIVRKW